VLLTFSSTITFNCTLHPQVLFQSISGDHRRSSNIFLMVTRRSQHSQEGKDPCHRCFCNSWYLPLTFCWK